MKYKIHIPGKKCIWLEISLSEIEEEEKEESDSENHKHLYGLLRK